MVEFYKRSASTLSQAPIARVTMQSASLGAVTGSVVPHAR